MAVTALFSEVRPEPDEEELNRLTETWVRQAEWIREQWDRRKSAGAGR
jgi:hypothetical protein